MAKEETRRLTQRTLKEDNDCLVAIKGMTGYKPAKDDFKLSSLAAAGDELKDAQEKEKETADTATAAYDRATAAQWALHNLILGAKKQVIAQFGENSDQVKAVGLKKKTEYKRSGGRKTKSKAA